MADWSELKRLAERENQLFEDVTPEASFEWPDAHDELAAVLVGGCFTKTILALIAENERLRDDVKDHADARAHYCGKVGEIAGERDQLARRLRMYELVHGGRASELVSEVHALRAEVRRLKILAGEDVPPLPEEFVGPMPERPYERLRRKLQERVKSETQGEDSDG